MARVSKRPRRPSRHRHRTRALPLHGHAQEGPLAFESGAASADRLGRFRSDLKLGTSLRLYDPKTQNTMGPPVFGSFDGKPIKVRFTWSKLSVDHARWQQAFSKDNGKTWETNWVMGNERVHETDSIDAPVAIVPGDEHSHDFDFWMGTWVSKNRRLKERLKGSTEWLEFEATLARS